jgi:hypothetical protein
LTRHRTLAGCFSPGKHGALSYDGTSLVDGISTVVVRDRGNRPGDAPSLMYISATAPYLLLREVQTGPSRPGGGSDPNCRLSPRDYSQPRARSSRRCFTHQGPGSP